MGGGGLCVLLSFPEVHNPLRRGREGVDGGGCDRETSREINRPVSGRGPSRPRRRVGSPDGQRRPRRVEPGPRGSFLRVEVVARVEESGA